MRIWAIGDLHLSIGLPPDLAKPMDIFGDHWHDHNQIIEKNWRTLIAPEDIVLVPGDICWANAWHQALPALEWIAALPGHKILLRGNHDNWWQGIQRMRQEMPKGISLIHNDAIYVGDIGIAGARGWTYAPTDTAAHNEKMHRREMLRLQQSLEFLKEEVSFKIVMMHFPPFPKDDMSSDYMDLMESHHVDLCIFGHLHDAEGHAFRDFRYNGIKYQIVSADILDFSPICIYNNKQKGEL